MLQQTIFVKETMVTITLFSRKYSVSLIPIRTWIFVEYFNKSNDFFLQNLKLTYRFV